jgi:aspartate oxidase
VNKDNDRLTTAKKEAENLQKFREDERQKLTSDLTGINKERAAIERHLAQVNQQLTRAHTLTAELMRSNDQLTALLAARQAPSRSPASGVTSPTSDFPLTPAPRSGR